MGKRVEVARKSDDVDKKQYKTNTYNQLVFQQSIAITENIFWCQESFTSIPYFLDIK